MKEDVIFGLNVIRNCRSVCQCSVSGYLYRVRQTSACNVKRKYSDCYRFVSEVSALWKRTVESEEGILGDEKVRAAVSRSLWDDFAQWARSRDCKLDDKEKIGKLKMLMCGLLRADVIALTPDRVPWVLSKFALKYLNAIWPVFAFVWLMRFKTAVVRCVVGCCRGGSAV